MPRHFFLGGLLLLLTACGDPEEIAPTTPVELEGLTLTSLDGKAVPFEEYRGKTLVVNIWATWCAPCREEMPALQALSEQLDPDRYAVLGISTDKDLNLVREFLLKYDIHFRQFSDPDMVMSSERLQVSVLPVTLVITPDGELRRRIVGVRDWVDPAFINSILPLRGENG